MLVLSLLICIVLWGGDRTRPYVREFSWHNKQVGAADTFFVLAFSRPMDRASVEANLQIEPPLPGKGSWAGRRLVYTLTNPAPYGTSYTVELHEGRQSLGKPGNLMQPFVGQFRTRDRAFVYLGVEGDEKGRLVLYNLTHHKKTVLTPKELVVTDFEPYPTGDRILFAASDWSNYGPGLFEQQLYAVTTGLSGMSANQPKSTQNAGQIDLILDNKDYQNLKFDLSADGQVIVVFRVNRRHIEDSGLWVLRRDAPWQPLLKQPGGDFLITPDSAAIANARGEGVAIVPLTPQAKPLDFLPKFDKVLGFSRDGVRAAMVKSNSDLTQSLFLVTNQGFQKELLNINGEFLNCQFAPNGQSLYCLINQLVEKKEYSQQLSIQGIDLQQFNVKSLLVLSKPSEVEMSLSPDGLALLLDRVVTKETLPAKEDLTTDVGSAIATSHLFLLPLTNTMPELNAPPESPQDLAVRGFHPLWLP
jgi:hypothetical protein